MATNIHGDDSHGEGGACRRKQPRFWFYFFLVMFLGSSALCYDVFHPWGLDRAMEILGPSLVSGFTIIPLIAFFCMVLAWVHSSLQGPVGEGRGELDLTGPPSQLILENDDYHTFQFVLDVLRKALGCTEREAFQIAANAHRTGRAVAWAGSKEEANLKRQLLQSFRELGSNGADLGPLKIAIEHRFHVVLLNDDDHSYAYVIDMLAILLGHSPEVGFALAKEVDTTGRVIVAITSKENAEILQERIHSFGPDPIISRCRGSMSAKIESVE